MRVKDWVGFCSRPEGRCHVVQGISDCCRSQGAEICCRVGCFSHGVGKSGKDEVFVIWGEVVEEWVEFELDSFEEDEPTLPSQSSLLPSCCGDGFLTGIVRSKDVIQEIISGGSGRRSVTFGSCEAVEGEVAKRERIFSSER